MRSRLTSKKRAHRCQALVSGHMTVGRMLQPVSHTALYMFPSFQIVPFSPDYSLPSPIKMASEELTKSVAIIISTINRSIKNYDKVAGKGLKLHDDFEVITSPIENYNNVAGNGSELHDDFEVITSPIETYD